MMQKIRNWIKNITRKEQPTEEIYYKPHPTTEGRGTVILKSKQKSICSCYKEEFEKVKTEFLQEYNGTNFDELQEKYKNKYNIRHKSRKKQKPKKTRKITRLEDTNIRFNQRKNDPRVDAHTYINGKNYAICRCYPDQKTQVRRDYNRMKKQKNNTIEKIHSKLARKYNLKTRTIQKPDKIWMEWEGSDHKISVTEKGMVYRDGKYINTIGQIVNE